MGSVQDNINCPNCGSNKCFNDSNYKTDENTTFCPDCGFYESYTYERNENGELKRKDENGSFDFPNLIPEHIVIDKPFAAFHIIHNDKSRTIGTIKNDTEYLDFLTEIENSSLDNVENVFITKLVTDFNEKKIEKIVLHTKN